MITINGKQIELKHFPDNTFLINPNLTNGKFTEMLLKQSWIMWNYESPEELTALIYLTGYLKDNGAEEITLIMPYIPNARQDRIKSNKDIFTLKYFCQVINQLNFKRVVVFDPHSHVSEALIDRLTIYTPEKLINKWLSTLKEKIPDDFNKIVLYYPDEGAMKRYSTMFKLPFAYGVKNRDWETGKILSTQIITNGVELKGKTVLIIDDICSKGGTFIHAINELKKFEVADVMLYVSHCETTIFKGDLLKEDLLKLVLTTDSIFRYDFDAPENAENAKYKKQFVVIPVIGKNELKTYQNTCKELENLETLFGDTFGSDFFKNMGGLF